MDIPFVENIENLALTSILDSSIKISSMMVKFVKLRFQLFLFFRKVPLDIKRRQTLDNDI